MNTLYIALGSTLLLTLLILGWRRSAVLNGKLKEQVRHEREINEKLQSQLEAISAPLPSSSDMQHVFVFDHDEG